MIVNRVRMVLLLKYVYHFSPYLIEKRVHANCKEKWLYDMRVMISIC